MSKPSRAEELRATWARAVERDKPRDAVEALVELERLEPEEPIWSHRLGDAYRRLRKKNEAEEAFVRAMQRYVEKGFMPRAIAMAKLVESLNPARASLLGPLPPKPAAPPTPKPVVLERAKDASADEVRFVDAPGRSSIEIVLEDVSEEILAVADPVPPTTRVSLPPPEEPSIDRLATLAGVRLFAALSREALLELSAAAELVEFVPGAMVMMRDEPAYALYAIVDGAVRVLVRGASVNASASVGGGGAGGEVRLGPGDVVGEACLLGEGTRQADVKAETAVMALRIGKTSLDEATKRHAEIGDALFDLLARRLLMNLMQTSPLFTVFEPKVRLELAQLFEVRRAEPGTVLAERGKTSDGLYVLLAGNVVADRPETRVARGTAFGHGSLLGEAPAHETVRAVSEAVLLRLPAAAFGSLAALYPPALAHLSETAGEPLPLSRLLGD
jgi:CRP-like cAMP-binding protein